MSAFVFTFDSTHMALWAEEVVLGRGIAAEVVPAPPHSGALCDLALAVPASRVADVESALRDEGVEFRPHVPGGA